MRARTRHEGRGVAEERRGVPAPSAQKCAGVAAKPGRFRRGLAAGAQRGLRQLALTRGQPPWEAPFAVSRAAKRLFISKPTNS